MTRTEAKAKAARVRIFIRSAQNELAGENPSLATARVLDCEARALVFIGKAIREAQGSEGFAPIGLDNSLRDAVAHLNVGDWAEVLRTLDEALDQVPSLITATAHQSEGIYLVFMLVCACGMLVGGILCAFVSWCFPP